MDDKRKVTLYLSADAMKKMQHAAIELSTSVSQMINDLVEQFLKKTEKKAASQHKETR